MKKFAALVAVLALICFAAPAFAANPFMDVPMNHWAYDAVSQLASRGVVSGYPDGAFKGEWKATRYEMASVVARALAYVDMNKASKQDLELLKKLVVEFKDELDALGVKVDELDARVAVLESDIGGWKLSGEFRFDAKWADNSWPPAIDGFDGYIGGWDEDNYITAPLNAYTTTGDTDFTMSRYRLWISKRIDDKVTFIGRVGGNALSWERYYLSVMLPWDATMWVGLWNFDWEADSGLYADNDAWFTDQTLQGFYLTKDFSGGNFDFFVAHEEGSYPISHGSGDPGVILAELAEGDLGDMNFEGYWIGARLNYHFNENFRMAGNALWRTLDDDYLDLHTSIFTPDTFDTMNVYWVDAGINFTPDIELKLAYFWQNYTGLNQWDILYDIPDSLDDFTLGDLDANAWKVIVDVKQEAFGFTSVWLEYAHFDKHFFTMNSPYDDYTNGWLWGTLTPGLSSFGLPIVGGVPALAPGLWGGLPADSDAILVLLNQKWNDKWETFQRYVDFDMGAVPFYYDDGSLAAAGNTVLGMVDLDVQEWNVGVRYWYTSNLSFELSYSNYRLSGDAAWLVDEVDMDPYTGSGSATVEDNMIRLRTYVSF